MSDHLPESVRAAPVTPDLNAQAHDQIMDFIRLADRSKNPAIAAAAIKLARERQRQQRRLQAKISPVLAAFLGTAIAIAAAGACWYALVRHPGGLGVELAIVVITITVLVISLYALFSGYLSQSNFMAVIQWVGDRLKQIYPTSNGTDADHSITASDDKQLPPPSKN
jgi:hypothetical protein